MKLKEVMLIDDNYIDNYIINIVIAKENIAENITLKSSSMEALDYLKDKKDAFPDLIFLDIKMPVMDGFEFLIEFEKLADSKKDNCAVVMLSSSNSPTDLETAKNNPYVLAYLSKPLTMPNLNNVLELILQKRIK